MAGPQNPRSTGGVRVKGNEPMTNRCTDERVPLSPAVQSPPASIGPREHVPERIEIRNFSQLGQRKEHSGDDAQTAYISL